MPTPSIQTLVTDAQQILNLDSISAVRSVVAVALANANTGTPLNPNLTTQQLWNEFYQVVNKPKSDIESIIANQLMKLLFAPPAPGGVGADKQVIFNDGGVLAGDPQFLWNKTTNLLTVTGSATITGDLTVATDRLKVVTGSTAIQTGATTQLQVGTTSWPSTVIGKSGSRSLFGNAGEVIIWNEAAPAIGNYSTLFVSAKTGAGATTMGGLQIRAGIENASNSDGFVSLWTSNSAAGGFVERYKIDSTGVATWSNVGGVAGTAMTLNSTGLGVGGSPLGALDIRGTSSLTYDTSGNLFGLANIGTKGTSGGNLVIQTASATSTFGSALVIDGTYSGLTSTIRFRALGVNSAAYGSQISFSTTASGTIIERMLIDPSGNVGIGGNASVTGIDTGVARLFVVAPNSNTGMAATFIADSVGRGLLVADQGKTNSFGVEVVAGLVKTGGFTSGTSVALFANAVERARVKSTGQVRFVPLAADPSGAEAGDVYYNSSSNKLKCYNGSTWNDLF